MAVTYDTGEPLIGGEWSRAADPAGSGLGLSSGCTVTKETTIVHRGSASCRFFLAPSGGSHRAEWGSFGPFKKYVWEYFGVAYYLPVGFDWNSTGPWGVVVSQVIQNDQYAAPCSLNLGGPGDAINAGVDRRALRMTNQSGIVPGYDTPPTQYSTYTTVIPVPMLTGVWYEVIMGVWITDLDNGTGKQLSWWRTKGQTAWNTGGGIVGYPTLEYFTEGNANSRINYPSTPPNYSHKWGAYRGGSSLSLTMYHDTCCRGSTFEVVDAMLTNGGPSYQMSINNLPAG